ncbi:MAG: hypothetical protein ABIQ78_08830 [Dokdonella sp.]
MKHLNTRKCAIATLAAAIAVGSFSAHATHSWNNYHWARTTSSFNLHTLDSTVANSNANWPGLLRTAASQWTQSTKLDLTVAAYANDSNSRRKCSAVSGKIRVCNQSYGKNGWLGLASINLDSNGHISQGTAKMNDSYTSSWTDPNEAPHVMCQEVGHTFGLDHQSTDGSSQGTCMDYSNSPSSTAPNAHDYNELVTIYGHTDSYNSYSTTSPFPASRAQNAMAGEVPMGHLVHQGAFEETWVAPDGKGGLWINHVTLAPLED